MDTSEETALESFEREIFFTVENDIVKDLKAILQLL